MTRSTPFSLPAGDDLLGLLQFSPKDGRIWLGENRMLLVHASSLGTLRRDIIHAVGIGNARRMFMRAGYASGVRDAELTRKIRKDANNLFDVFAIGPQLHMLEGAVEVLPEDYEFDAETQRYHGVFRWNKSWEAEAHLREFGIQTDPVCWMLVGYASGYTSSFVGKPVFFKETSCEACGDSQCRIEGRNQRDWPDGNDLAQDYNPDSLKLEPCHFKEQVDCLRSKFKAEDDLGPLIGHSPAFDSALDLMQKAAKTQVTVLLTGESGVGKERFARSLHAISNRSDKTFIAINCAALPNELIEAELFGVEKGAYTGAHAARQGRFERADGGTLFLDELGELPLSAQAKLLRILQDGFVERLGSEKAIKVNVRIIAATNLDLEQAVSTGKFRQDLFYRLNVYPIQIPALRQRKEDIEPLALHVLQNFSERHNKKISGISELAREAMLSHEWPGNVRELENLIERAVILTPEGGVIDVHHIFPKHTKRDTLSPNINGRLDKSPDPSFVQPPTIEEQFFSGDIGLEQLEQRLIMEAVNRCNGNLSAASRALGITRPQLCYRLKQYDGPKD